MHGLDSKLLCSLFHPVTTKGGKFFEKVMINFQYSNFIYAAGFIIQNTQQNQFEKILGLLTFENKTEKTLFSAPADS